MIDQFWNVLEEVECGVLECFALELSLGLIVDFDYEDWIVDLDCEDWSWMEVSMDLRVV